MSFSMRMDGIRIHDGIQTSQGGFLSFDLQDILRLIGEEATRSRWRCRWVECVGKRAAEFHALSDGAQVVAGAELLRIATEIDQTIDGDFEAFRDDVEAPWLIIRAVDSSWFDVLSSQLAVLARLKQHFREVTDYDPEAGETS